MSTPLLTDVKINYLGNTVDKETVTPTCFLNFFEGSEIVVAGKLRDMTADNIVSQVTKKVHLSTNNKIVSQVTKKVHLSRNNKIVSQGIQKSSFIINK